MSELILRTRGLCYTYGPSTPFECTAIHDINVDIYRGDFIGLIGHTGSGKSTFIQHLNGLMQPTSGTVEYMGRDIWQKNYPRRQLRFDVGLVFQYPEYQLFEETVEKDISFGPRNMGLGPEDIKSRVLSSVEAVGLGPEILDKSPFELSGGQKRRVAIAGILSMRPKVLILDEPTAGLDPRGREEILGYIKKYQSSENATVILVSHSMEDVADYAHRIMVMHDGETAMFDTLPAVFSRAEELMAMGLDIPQITKVFIELKKCGYDVDTAVYTLDRAADIIVSAAAKGK